MESIIQGNGFSRRWHNQVGSSVGILTLPKFVAHTADWEKRLGYSKKKKPIEFPGVN